MLPATFWSNVTTSRSPPPPCNGTAADVTCTTWAGSRAPNDLPVTVSPAASFT